MWRIATASQRVTEQLFKPSSKRACSMLDGVVQIFEAASLLHPKAIPNSSVIRLTALFLM